MNLIDFNLEGLQLDKNLTPRLFFGRRKFCF